MAFSLVRTRLAALLCVFAVAATIATPATAQTGGTLTGEPAPSGFWVGFVNFTGAIRDTQISPEGSFTLEVLDGEAVGEFDWFGITTSSPAGPVTVDISGEISGPAEEIELTLTRVVTNGNPVAGSDFGGGAVAWSLVTCERIEGVPTRIDTQASITDIEFWAIRTDVARDPGLFFATLKSLRDQMDDVQEGFETGSVPPDELLGRLDTLVETGELLAGSLLRDAECLDKTYASLLAEEFGELLKWALAEARLGGIESDILHRIVMLGLGAGLFTIDGDYYNDGVDSDVWDLTNERIDEAIALSDLDELLLWWSIAYSLGYEILADDALTAIGALS